MFERIMIHRGTYHDSAFLMRVSRDLKQLEGISEAVVLMGTPMNCQLITEAGFKDPQLSTVTPLDVVIALRAQHADQIEKAQKVLHQRLSGEGEAEASGTGRADQARVRSIAEAAKALPSAKIVTIAVPGVYAAYVARRALDEEKHVFLFSDNVALEDEIALKKRGVEEGLLVMGPDCGTAIIGGVGLGFANRVPRGNIGLIGPSGTGIQEASCLLARLGGGVSQAIGTGSRDLKTAVGGLMTEFGCRLLAEDKESKVLLVVAKKPDEEVATRLHQIFLSLGKPVVVRYLGQKAPGPAKATDKVFYAETIDEAAIVSLALSRGQAPERTAQIGAISAGNLPKSSGRLVGLFSGGSLASEAKLVLASQKLESETPERALVPGQPLPGQAHLVIDTGDDFYTLGRPHPMVDQTVRCELIRSIGGDPTVGVLLLDVVLGDGAHLNPAPEIAAAVQAARTQRGKKPLAVVISLCGTAQDPQHLEQQEKALTEAQIIVQPTAARAAMQAALILQASK